MKKRVLNIVSLVWALVTSLMLCYSLILSWYQSLEEEACDMSCVAVHETAKKIVSASLFSVGECWSGSLDCQRERGELETWAWCMETDVCASDTTCVDAVEDATLESSRCQERSWTWYVGRDDLNYCQRSSIRWLQRDHCRERAWIYSKNLYLEFLIVVV